MSKVLIYGAVYCSFCLKAKMFFKTKNIPITWIDTQEQPGKTQLKQLQIKYNWRTIPMIFINGKFVGGYNDMRKEVNDLV